MRAGYDNIYSFIYYIFQRRDDRRRPAQMTNDVSTTLLGNAACAAHVARCDISVGRRRRRGYR